VAAGRCVPEDQIVDDAGSDGSDTGDDGGSDTSDAQDDVDAQTCQTPNRVCGGECVNVDESDDHCGGCDSPCEPGVNQTATCNGGSCERDCNEGYFNANGDPADGCECEITNGGEETCDGVDNDCDGDTDEDFPEAGRSCTAGEGECQATGNWTCDNGSLTCDAEVGTPATSEETACDNRDEDCDGEVDEDCDVDGDGWCDNELPIAGTLKCGAGGDVGDCDDNNPDVHPNAPGLCDGLDNDCNGQVDEVRISAVSTVQHSSSLEDSATTSDRRQTIGVGTSDGFCAFVFHEMDFEGEFVQFDVAASAAVRKPVTIAQEIKLLDIADDGASCTLLYYGDSGRLTVLRYDRSSGAVESLTLSTDFQRSFSEEMFNGALTSVGSNPSRWVVAYVESSGVNQEVRTVELPANFTGSTTVNETPEHTINSASDRSRGIYFGASPVATDDFLLSFRLSSAELAMRSYRSGNTTNRDFTGTSIFEYEFGTTSQIGGSTYVTTRDNSSQFYFYELDSTYSISTSSSIYNGPTGASTPTEIRRDVFAYGGHSPSFMLDTWDDVLVSIERASDGTLTFSDRSFRDWAGDDVIAINERDDGLDVLRLSQKRPYILHVDALTCH
jgi:hypothetical protein